MKRIGQPGRSAGGFRPCPEVAGYLPDHVVASLQRGYFPDLGHCRLRSTFSSSHVFFVAALEPEAKAWLSRRMPNADRGHLPRLPDAAYIGRVFVHWSMTIHQRKTGWLTTDFHARFRALLHRNAFRYAVVVPAYCLMPDHLHVVSAGVTDASDHQLWSRSTRRQCNQLFAPERLQKQAHDHVLRPAESGADAFAALVHYVCQNPVRAGLVGRAEEWPFIGSVVPELPDLDPRRSDFAELWWRYWNAVPS